MYNKRLKYSITQSNWPFKKDEYAKLYWIDHPYRDFHGNWRVALYFKRIPNGEIKRCDVQWGTINILRIGRIYKGGNLLTRESDIPKDLLNYAFRKQGKFSFKKNCFSCSEGQYIIPTIDGKEHAVIKNAFVGEYEGTSIHIPVIEVLRAVLIKNRKLVYAILEPNGLDNLFISRVNYYDSSQFEMFFTKEFPRDLLTKQNLRHLLWLSTDEQAQFAWRAVYRSLIKQDYKGIRFPFPYEVNFELEFRYRQDGNIIRVEEIMHSISYEKGVDYKNIIIESPYLNNIFHSDEVKKNKYVKKDNKTELTLNANSDNARKLDRLINIENADCEFAYTPEMILVRNNSITIRNKEDENTKTVAFKDDNMVSTGDIGGKDKLPGIEYENFNKDKIIYDGDIGDFIKILKCLNDQFPHVSVNFNIDNLPEGKEGKRFCRLEDGITPRKYLLVRIEILHKKDLNLIEIERNGKSLSTLIMKAGTAILDHDNLVKVVNNILVGLVDNNGVWNNEILNDIEKKGVEIRRIKHVLSTNKVYELAEKLFEKLLSFTF